jgi:thiol-disulfide isomerase/thioredoxin
MVEKKSKKGKTKGTNHVDVRSSEDIPLLKDIMDKNKKTIILVYADYCGHCHTYKDNVWNDLISNEKRRHGMASIHYDQMEKTPLANTKVSGYPTVLVLGENKTPMKFKNEETGEEEVDYPESRNKDAMETLLNSEEESSEPETILEPENSVEENSLDLDESSIENRINTPEGAENIVNSVEKEKPSLKPKRGAVVPNYRNDISMEFNENAGEAPTPGRGTAVGGSLYMAMLDSIKPRRKTKRRKNKKVRKSRRRS